MIQALKSEEITAERGKFRGLVPTLKSMNALVIGCGSLGSHLIAMLARMGPKTIYCVDHDLVSRENLGVQDFCKYDVGRYKATIVASNNEGPTRIVPFISRFEDLAKAGTVSKLITKRLTHIFLCVDTMRVRKRIYKHAVELYGFEGVLVDGRLDANVGWVYAAQKQHTGKWFDTTVYSDKEVIEVDQHCAIQMTGYSAHVIAGMMVAQAMRLSQDENLNNLKCGIDLNNMIFFPAEMTP